jgi:hypothetical protein
LLGRLSFFLFLIYLGIIFQWKAIALAKYILYEKMESWSIQEKCIWQQLATILEAA